MNRAISKDELIWKKFQCLDDGFITLVDMMGEDASVVQAARVSYGKDYRNDRELLLEVLVDMFGEEGGESTYGTPSSYRPEGFKRDYSREQMDAAWKKISGDAEKLIRYLMRHWHTTPFEMVEFKFLVRCPMDCWRQWIRHRTASVNEYSTRYTEAIDARQKASKWRLQSKSSKQGSAEGEVRWPEGYQISEASEGFNITHPDRDPFFCHSGRPEDYLSERENALHSMAQSVYEERLKFGVAKEQARKDLPLSTYTEAYWKLNLHNMLHFLRLRMDSHAQAEIREYATIIGEKIVKPTLPIVWQAFEDYRLNALSLSALDIQVTRKLLLEVPNGQGGLYTKNQFLMNQHDSWKEMVKQCRERDECLAKLQHLGMVEA
jgi:thymidylate synthase (FAD)